MRSPGQGALIIPELKFQAGASRKNRSSGPGEKEKYERSFTSQSVQLKHRAGTVRQSASDAVNTRLL
jgi:hypothetical protein